MLSCELIEKKNNDQLHSPSSLKHDFGQYFTPVNIANFMAQLFVKTDVPFHLLDPGAGVGVLTRAFFDKFPDTRLVSLFERDLDIIPSLKRTISDCNLTANIYADFIEAGVFMALRGVRPFSHVIMNPPYKKISSKSRERLLLRDVGIETVNLYSGFVDLALKLLAPHGELVAIIPRSFCNGPYYRSFRNDILGMSAIKRIHLFGSRTDAFRSDGVLQENVIILLERDGKQGDIEISTSSDGSFNDLETRIFPSSAIIDSGSEHFLKIPGKQQVKAFKKADKSLSSIFLEVSTGPVVDFRMKDYLHKMPDNDDVPLLYPAHFLKGFAWPKEELKKYNSIRFCRETMKWLFPSGWYVVTRRLSSKEEKRRIVANIINPAYFPHSSYLGFENHFNVFHRNRHGLEENIARGLAAYLGSERIDAIFRTFNGHTQVNATDLRNLPYPSLDILDEIGRFVASEKPTPEELDKWLEIELN